MTNSHRARRGASFLHLPLVLALAACGAAAAPSPSPTPDPTPTPVPGASGVPGGAAIGGGGGGGGGSSGSGIGGGIIPPGGVDPGDPTLGQAQLVVPQPGTVDPHPVSVAVIRSAVDGRHLSVELRWWSGVAPCTILDSIKIDRDGSTFTLTPMEGSGGGNVACEDIALLKATVVDLGDLDPGTYTIHASGNPEPAPIQVTIS